MLLLLLLLRLLLLLLLLSPPPHLLLENPKNIGRCNFKVVIHNSLFCNFPQNPLPFLPFQLLLFQIVMKSFRRNTIIPAHHLMLFSKTLRSYTFSLYLPASKYKAIRFFFLHITVLTGLHHIIKINKINT